MDKKFIQGRMRQVRFWFLFLLLSFWMYLTCQS
jgi:hypothetical protein